VRVALYARVSTKQHGQNPETQLQPLRAHAAHKGYIVCEEYVDLGVSGSKESRPQLDRLMRAAREKKFDAILVWRFDRFARSVLHLIKAINEFAQIGVDFISLTEGIDTKTIMGKAMATLTGLFAELERNLIQERVQAGVDRAKRQGTRLGRPTVLVDRERIRERVAAKEPIAKIARETGIARSTVRAIAGVNAKQKGGETLLSHSIVSDDAR
jgi:DNA invertase Pin-like site-specific DNA recombinase